MTLVLDASVVLSISSVEDGFRFFRGEELVAPPHMWAEARSALHEALWRREVSDELARATFDRLGRAPVRSRHPRHLGREAWRVAEQLGWAKTYDAEYVALAHLLGCRLVTHDGRLLRGTTALGFVVSLSDL